MAVMSSLLALCAVLSVVAYGEWTAPIGGETAAPPAASKRTAETEARAPEGLPPLSQFAEVTERPLFQQSRRGSAEADGGGSAAFTDLTLAGVIVTPDTRQALIAHGEPAEVVYRREGQSVDGWMVTSIKSERVVVQNGPESHELRLIKPSDEKNPSDQPDGYADGDGYEDHLPERPHPRGR